MSIARRQFVKRSAATVAAVGMPMVASSRVFGADEEIRVGIAGLGGQGKGSHVPGFRTDMSSNALSLFLQEKLG
jgi:hypothetical protein